MHKVAHAERKGVCKVIERDWVKDYIQRTMEYVGDNGIRHIRIHISTYDNYEVPDLNSCTCQV